jgi:hypothetical protein
MPRDGSAADTRRKLDRLRAVARTPGAADHALELIASDRQAEVLLAALKVLSEAPHHGAHDALIARYEEFERGGRQRDAGGFVRAAFLQALEPLVLPGDLPLLIRAVQVHEPSPQDAAAPTGLRAAAIAAMLRLDPDLASYHAVAMLHDERRTSHFTGEPAVTAVRVLAAAGQEVALVGFALGGGHPEVVAECLRELRTVPPAVLAKVVESARHAAEMDDVVALGLCDLFVHHAPDSALLAAMSEFMRRAASPELYHYLAAAIVAERREDLLAALADVAREETDREKLRALAEALAVRRGDPAVAAILATVEPPLRADRR